MRLFEDIDAGDLTEMAASMSLRRYRAGEVIFHQGDPGDALHVVVSGAVKCSCPRPTARRRSWPRLRRQAFFGELALLDRGSQSTTAIALEPTETLSVPRATFMDLIGVHACAREVVLATMATELRRLTGRVEALHFLDVSGRVADVLVGLSHEHGRRLQPGPGTPAGSIRIDGRLTQGDLAAMVNSSRQSVNQAAGRAGRRGDRPLRTGRRSSILAPDRLARRAGL